MLVFCHGSSAPNEQHSRMGSSSRVLASTQPGSLAGSPCVCLPGLVGSCSNCQLGADMALATVKDLVIS